MMRNGLSQVQWVIVTLTVLMFFLVIAYGAYSGTVQAAIDQLTEFIDQGNASAQDSLNDPAPQPGTGSGTAAPGTGDGRVVRPVSRPAGG